MGTKQGLKPDTVLKNYWNGNEEFADLFNAVLFEGEDVIKPNELENVDTEESVIFEHREYAQTIQAARDTIKIQKKSTAFGVELVLLGLENQEHIHYAMPMRVMGYDYHSYKKQYESNAKKYKEKFSHMSDDEFISKMRKEDKFIPVITVVVYYGEKEWDGAKSLYEMLNIPEKMKPFVNDYKMILVEARRNNLILHNVNNRDLFNLLEIILDRNIPRKDAKKRAIDYSDLHKPNKSVVMTVAGAANVKLDYSKLERSEDAVCTLFEEIAEEGKAEGIAEGKAAGIAEGKAAGIIEMGLDCGLPKEKIIEKLQVRLDVTKEQAEEYYARFAHVNV